MGAVVHPLLMVATGAALGYVLVTLVALGWLVADMIAAGRVAEVVVWPDPRSLTVWTGEAWFTATVMPVAFGRWGVAVCRDEAPRRPGPVELVTRVRTEEDARDRAGQLIGHALAGSLPERVALVAAR